MNAPAAEDQAEAFICPSAVACLSRISQYAGDIAKGDRAFVRTDSAKAALCVLRAYMAPDVLAELGRLIAEEFAARESAT